MKQRGRDYLHSIIAWAGYDQPPVHHKESLHMHPSLKSAIFGFTLPIQHVFSMQLDCSFAQTNQLALLHFQWYGLTYQPLATSRSLSSDTAVNPLYCRGYELYVNEWEEVIDQTIGQILGDCADQEPAARIKRLRQALSYWLPKCEKTVALVQMDLASRDHTQTIVNIHLAWGKETLRRDTLKAHRFIREFTQRLKQLHIHYHSLIDNPGALPGK